MTLLTKDDIVDMGPGEIAAERYFGHPIGDTFTYAGQTMVYVKLKGGGDPEPKELITADVIRKVLK